MLLDLGFDFARLFWTIVSMLVLLMTNNINPGNRLIEFKRNLRQHVLHVEYRLDDLVKRLPVAD